MTTAAIFKLLCRLFETRRQAKSLFWILLLVSQALFAFYVVYLFRVVVHGKDWVDEAKCRQEFLTMYDDMCRHSLRPLPVNFLDQLSGKEERIDLCPCVPADIDPSVSVNFNSSVTWDELKRIHAGQSVTSRQQLTTTGRWRPLWCIARHRIAIIVPYRDREQHLIAFMNNMHKFLRSQLLDYNIFVVEQLEPEIFNRGALMNVGFVEAIKQAGVGEFDCFIFHDVDLIPADAHNFYVCSVLPRHMAAYLDKWNYSLLYEGHFGGINSFRAAHFTMINGFSNQFYGWGGEDDDLLLRMQATNLNASSRYPECVSKYIAIEHERDVGNPTNVNKDLGVEYRPEVYKRDGLNSLNYTLLNYQRLTLYTKISVRLPPAPIVNTGVTCHTSRVSFSVHLHVMATVFVIGYLDYT